MKNTELDPRFKIRAPLRCDGIGRLDCAEDTVSGGRLAVRWLPLDANGALAAKACETLPQHPTLPRIRKTGTANGSAWVAMDFPDGRLMSTVLDAALPGDVVAAVGAQISDALASIHAQGVFHGELSAESVLLVPGNKAFLWDMPLVVANRLTDRRGEERLMHQLVRTAPFLSPERARGAAPSAEGDVYALAAVLCLAGGAQAPASQSTLGVVHLVATHGWAPTVPSRFVESMRRMLERMLDREPARRPSAREVADLFGRPAALPTVPEMQAIRLPPEVLAQALAQKPVEVLDARASVSAPARAAAEAEADDAVDAQASFSDADALRGAAVHLALHDAAEALRAAALEPQASGPALSDVEASAPALVVEPAPAASPALELQPAPAPQVIKPPRSVERAIAVTQPFAASPEQVQLTDTLSVAPELVEQGAMALSLEDSGAFRLRRSKLPMVLAGVGAAVLGVVLVAALSSGRSKPMAAAVSKAPAPTRAKAVVVAAPVEPTVEEDDELAPLPTPRPPRARKSAAAVQPAPVLASEPAAAVPSTPPASEADFGFLEPGEKPTEELKRPQL